MNIYDGQDPCVIYLVPEFAFVLCKLRNTTMCLRCIISLSLSLSLSHALSLSLSLSLLYTILKVSERDEYIHTCAPSTLTL